MKQTDATDLLCSLLLRPPLCTAYFVASHAAQRRTRAQAAHPYVHAEHGLGKATLAEGLTPPSASLSLARRRYRFCRFLHDGPPLLLSVCLPSSSPSPSLGPRRDVFLCWSCRQTGAAQLPTASRGGTRTPLQPKVKTTINRAALFADFIMLIQVRTYSRYCACMYSAVLYGAGAAKEETRCISSPAGHLLLLSTARVSTPRPTDTRTKPPLVASL